MPSFTSPRHRLLCYLDLSYHMDATYSQSTAYLYPAAISAMPTERELLHDTARATLVATHTRVMLR